MKPILTYMGNKLSQHTVDGSIYNQGQSGSFAFLIASKVTATDTVEVVGRLLGKFYSLATIYCANPFYVSQNINELAYGIDAVISHYNIAHDVLCLHQEVVDITEETVTRPLTLADILALAE